VIPETSWASTLPIEQIPSELVKLAALESALASRLIAEQMASRNPGADPKWTKIGQKESSMEVAKRVSA
jgi:hypothetical protein